MSVARTLRVGRGITRADTDAKVSPLELFFDLVFVFALTQVTGFMAADPTFETLGRALVLFALVWWAWSGYAWLTSTVDPEQVLPRVVMFGAMGAMLVLALATPGAFADDGTTWAVAYIALRIIHAALFGLGAQGDPALARNVWFLVLSTVPGGGLILFAALAVDDGSLRTLLWLAAAVLDYGIVLRADASGWRVHAEHFAERFGLVTIIAFGESIVAIGVGAEERALDAPVLASALAGLGIVCLLWWAYFDLAALIAQRRFEQAVGVEQVRIARDSYALLHLPMLAGVVLFALGTKKVLQAPDEHLKDMPAVALCAGLSLYAVAHVAFRARNTRTIGWTRLLVAALSAAVIPVAMTAPALAALALLLVIWTAVVGYEAVHFREVRARVRHAEQ